MPRESNIVHIGDWPAHIRAGFLSALESRRRYNRRRKRLSWGSCMRKNVCGAYGRWLYWSMQQDWYDPDLPLELVLTPDRVEAYVEYLKASGNKPATIRGRVTGLERMLCAVAPAAERTWLLDIRSRYKKTGDRAAKRARLQFTDVLIKFAGELARQAEELILVNFNRGFRLLRTALQIMMLAYCPMRLDNFTNLRWQEELKEVDGGWMFDVPAEATKTGNEYDPHLPPRVVSLLLRYMEFLEVAQVEACSAGGPVWISPNGQSQSARSIYYYVTKETEKKFGRSMSPHLFRDAVVTTVATYMPEDVMIGLPLIGNRDPACMEDHYNQAQRHVADQKYNAALDAFEDGE